MRNKEYQFVLSRIFKDILTITKAKGHDYAKDNDTLLNFKTVHKICKLLDVDPRRAPSECCLFFEIVKLARKCNLRGKSPKNESVLDSIKDQINYIGLGYACKVEEQK